MSFTVLTVLCPNARRHKVKVTPNSSVLQVLEEACKKQGFSSSDYELTFQNKVLDESCLLRYTGVPNNATLEMVSAAKSKVDSLVTVALQLQETSDRLVCQFNNSCCLWDILKHWHVIRGDVLKPDSGLMPVCVYMRREITGEGELKTTSLRSLGLTYGNAVIRLVYRTEGIVEQAHVSSNLARIVKPAEAIENVPFSYNVEIGRKTQNIESVLDEPSSLPIAKTQDDHGHRLDVQCSDQVTAMDFESEPQNYTVERVYARKVIHIDDSGSVIFHLDDMHIPSYYGISDLPDNFFDVTINDVWLLQADLQRKRKELEEQPLSTETYKTLQMQEKLVKYPKCVVRVQFPDRYVVQSTFPSDSKVSAILNFVKPFLAQSDEPFYLYTSPPKTILQEEQTLYQAGLVPAATVHFGCHHIQEQYLSREVLSKQYTEETVEAPSRSTDQYATGEIAASSSKEIPAIDRRKVEKDEATVWQRPTTRTSEPKIGKWFTLGKR